MRNLVTERLRPTLPPRGRLREQRGRLATFCRAAEADPEMERRVEEAARDHRSLALGQQALGKTICVLHPSQSRKDDCTSRGIDELELRPAVEEIPHQACVHVEQRARSRDQPIEVFRGENRQPLSDDGTGPVDDVASTTQPRRNRF
ncbi:hypothetical protein BH18ACI5_BH18ACI5_14880 [soil metagenome]